ncbi:MAG: 4-hydroxy-3-methylbut-2-enyl diphosphate reductase [Dehalococcoidia bacterium]|nr:4-hydroxy-3-methylbut-2-enyl diphosphate reductase [Dehalococcoidia bacterium]
MAVERASEMGFCFGVRRAIELVEKAAKEKGPLQTLGALVHNRQVVERLASIGVSVATHPEDVRSRSVAVASHGAAPDVVDKLKAKGIAIIDATCPFVRKAQVVSQRLRKAGFSVLVFGEASHPEVRGVLGWAGENASAATEVPGGDLPARLGILCQTTQDQEAFSAFIAQIMASKFARISELRVYNTICNATRKHQAAAVDLARKVDLILVVGGRDSANTKRLARICSDRGVETHHIETVGDIAAQWLKGHRKIGVTAGASTPDEVINEVVSALESVASKN